MSPIETILAAFAVFIGLPVLSYMVVKFGAAGLYQARKRQAKQKPKE